MVLLKNYIITAKVLILFSFKLLSADDKAHKDVRRDATIPHVVEGPSKIINVSPRQVVASNDGEKSMNDLLYEIYKKFSTDAKRHTADAKQNQQKKGIIIDADKVDSPPQMVVQPETAKDGGSQEGHKLALRELEKTVDRLINSITQVSKDGKFEGKDIKNDMQDLSKFADLTDLSNPTQDEKTNFEVESFDEFKDRFYKTFLGNEQKKEQSLIYHGKKSVKDNDQSLIYHGKRVNEVKQYHDNKVENAEWVQTKKENEKPSNSKSPQDQPNSQTYTKELNQKRVNELAKLYDELKKQTADATRARNVRKSSIRTNDNKAERNDEFEKLKNGLVSILDIANNNKRNTKEEPTGLTSQLTTKDENIARLKNDLTSLFDAIGNNEGSNNNDEIKQRGDSLDSRLKKELRTVVNSLQNMLSKKESTVDGVKNDMVAKSNDVTRNTQDNLDSNKSQNELKRQLLKVILNLETELKKENGGDLPNNGGFWKNPVGILPAINAPRPHTHITHHIPKASLIKTNDQYDNDLDSIVPENQKKELSGNKNFSTEEFIEALKGFVLTPKSSDKEKKK